MSAAGDGSVKTTWKYGTGSNSACRSANHVRPRRALAFWAMAVATGVVGDAEEIAFGAALDMTAELGGTACFDRRHYTTLDSAEMTGMLLTIRLAVAAEDIRHLQSRH